MICSCLLMIFTVEICYISTLEIIYFGPNHITQGSLNLSKVAVSLLSYCNMFISTFNSFLL